MNSTENDRRGMFGTAQPAFQVISRQFKPAAPGFQVCRFKRQITMVLNPMMLGSIKDVLDDNELRITAEKESIPTFLFSFKQKIADALTEVPAQTLLVQERQPITVVVNEEMADELVDVLTKAEDRLQSKGEDIPQYLFAFNTKLRDALDQPPPPKYRNESDEDGIRVVG